MEGLTQMSHYVGFRLPNLRPAKSRSAVGSSEIHVQFGNKLLIIFSGTNYAVDTFCGTRDENKLKEDTNRDKMFSSDRTVCQCSVLFIFCDNVCDVVDLHSLKLTQTLFSMIFGAAGKGNGKSCGRYIQRTSRSARRVVGACRSWAINEIFH